MQMLMLALLTVIAVGLGVVAVRAPLPVSAQQSQESVMVALGGVSTQLTAIQNALNKIYTKLGQVQHTQDQVYNNLNDDSKRLLAVCFMASENFGDKFPSLVSTTSAGGLARCTFDGWRTYNYLPNFNLPFEK
jgi:hypothetical protein